MNTYLVGDIQGCAVEFDTLLGALDLGGPGDQLWLLGDLINRGPDSVGVLRRVMQLGARCRVVLGNHDLSVLARLFTARDSGALTGAAAEIHNAPDRNELIDWLRHQSLAHHDRGLLMVHAGLPPQWDLETTLNCAQEVEQLLRGPDMGAFCAHMYGDKPARWSASLQGYKRWRFIINCLTRLRYCRADGRLALDHKGAPDSAQGTDVLPWFTHPERASQSQPIAFGHWSTLGQVYWPQQRVWGLDTGCVWGGWLSALHLESRRVIRVQGREYRKPG